jgi:anti-anti-sigma factor
VRPYEAGLTRGLAELQCLFSSIGSRPAFQLGSGKRYLEGGPMTNATSDGASQLTAELEYVNDDVLVIHLAGRLDIPGLLQLRKMLRALVPDRPWLILDVAAVPEFHSSTVTVLAAAQRRVRCHGSRLVVWRPQPQPAEILRHAGFHSAVEVVTAPVDQWLSSQHTTRS